MDKTLKYIITSLIIFGFISTNHVKVFAFEYTFTKTYRSIDDTITGKLNKQLLSQFKKYDFNIDSFIANMNKDTTYSFDDFLNITNKIYADTSLKQEEKFLIALGTYQIMSYLSKKENEILEKLYDTNDTDEFWEKEDIYEKIRMRTVLAKMDEEIAKNKEEITEKKKILAHMKWNIEELEKEEKATKEKIKELKKNQKNADDFIDYLRALKQKLDAMNKNKE